MALQPEDTTLAQQLGEVTTVLNNISVEQLALFCASSTLHGEPDEAMKTRSLQARLILQFAAQMQALTKYRG